MSRESMWATVRMAWTMLAGRTLGEVEPDRRRESPAPPSGDEPALSKEGFREEALPWLDAVYRFALRLTRGREDAAEDLVQETFLRAHRFWDSYERGTNAKSWLFTICRNVHLQGERRARVRPVSDRGVDPIAEALTDESAFGTAPQDPEEEFFAGLIDDEVVDAIDGLTEEFRDVLVLSDLET